MKTCFVISGFIIIGEYYLLYLSGLNVNPTFEGWVILVIIPISVISTGLWLGFLDKLSKDTVSKLKHESGTCKICDRYRFEMECATGDLTLISQATKRICEYFGINQHLFDSEHRLD